MCEINVTVAFLQLKQKLN